MSSSTKRYQLAFNHLLSPLFWDLHDFAYGEDLWHLAENPPKMVTTIALPTTRRVHLPVICTLLTPDWLFRNVSEVSFHTLRAGLAIQMTWQPESLVHPVSMSMVVYFGMVMPPLEGTVTYQDGTVYGLSDATPESWYSYDASLLHNKYGKKDVRLFFPDYCKIFSFHHPGVLSFCRED